MGDRTASVHGPDEPQAGSLTTPIHQTSTFALEDAAAIDDVYEGRAPDRDVYTRYTNPTLRAVERRLAQLERMQRALVTGSGMGAITTTLLTFVPAGGRIVATEDLYGGTLTLLKWLKERQNVRVDWVPTKDPSGIAHALREKPDLLYLESPTNPTVSLVDLKAAADAARAAGVVSAVDSTFATPVNSRPHELGVDLVLHSATKYLGGHADISAGAVCGSKAHLERIWTMHKTVGSVLDPHAAFLLERGLKTLPLRVKAANENAQRMAEHLERHPLVKKVHYPGLASHPQHALAKRQMPGGCGGLLSIDLASYAAARRFLDALKLIRNAASLGGVESLAMISVQQSHRGQPKEILARSGITEGTVRLALGVEDSDDLIADVEQALKSSS